VIHLYAFVLGAESVEGLVHLGGIDAVVGREEVDAVEHGLVVESLVGRCTSVLPARYGERFPDETALRRAAEPRLAELERRLDELAGCVEIGVRVAPPEERASVETGTDYMRAAGRRDADLRALDRRLQPRARRCADARYLVARSDLAGFAAEVERYAQEHPELAVVCTGPWAPYTFAAA
jgi:Gas vesicle synthesis protein GvpL/GvpF